MAEHLPVLEQAVVKAFGNLRTDAPVVDGTCGLGGHSAALLGAYPELRVIGIDRDPWAVEHAAARLRPFGGRALVRHGRAAEWPGHLGAMGVERAGGLLLDLGVSSPQLDRPERGFSFRGDGPLDMRMDPSTGDTALELLTHTPQAEIARWLGTYGEERHAGRIARRIVKAIEEGRLQTTGDLAAICRDAYGKGHHRIDPATRTFQALRIVVNNELAELEGALKQVPSFMEAGAVVAIISFHSLEDRIVKHQLREWDSAGLATILKPAPLTADESECVSNPRARSAKMRVCVWGPRASADIGKDKYRSKKHRQATQT